MSPKPVPYIPDHESQALAETPSVYKRSTRFTALVRALSAGVQLLEDEVYNLISALWLDTATGPGLDRLASLVGARRGALSDTELRSLVRGRVRVRRASGTSQDVFEVAQGLFPSARITVIELPPAHYTVQIQTAGGVSVGDEYRAQARAVLDLARPAGWGASYILAQTGLVFGFQPPTPTVAGYGIGAWASRL